jgi:ribose transport system ATP-binding protein
MRAQAAEHLKRLDVDISPNAMIDSLSVAQKQMVEIAKALVHESQILIMDEPTTMLTDHEVDVLFDLVRSLRDQGVTVVFISHKLKEVRRITDRVLILRDGKLITVSETSELSEHEMAQRMVGRELSQMYPEKKAPEDGVVFEVRGLTVEGVVEDINFTLKKGEILGFAGLVGAGRTELAETIIGIRKPTAGTIVIEGEEVHIPSPRSAVEAGIGYLSEDRLGKGIVLGFDIPSNVTLISLDRYARPFIDSQKTWAAANEYIDTFDIRAASLAYQLRYLSGGNQQKVYLAKWMDTNPKILILDEPTRGVDVNAKTELYRFIRSLTDQGISCLMISSEMEEIIGMCTRVYVMAGGRITGELAGDAITEEQIMYHAAELLEKR